MSTNIYDIALLIKQDYFHIIWVLDVYLSPIKTQKIEKKLNIRWENYTNIHVVDIWNYDISVDRC